MNRSRGLLNYMKFWSFGLFGPPFFCLDVMWPAGTNKNEEIARHLYRPGESPNCVAVRRKKKHPQRITSAASMSKIEARCRPFHSEGRVKAGLLICCGRCSTTMEYCQKKVYLTQDHNRGKQQQREGQAQVSLQQQSTLPICFLLKLVNLVGTFASGGRPDRLKKSSGDDSSNVGVAVTGQFGEMQARCPRGRFNRKKDGVNNYRKPKRLLLELKTLCLILSQV
jgi:hypothetical protein